MCPFDKKQPQNILVIRLSSLGDVILITPVIENIRRAIPAARLTVLTKEQYADVFGANPLIDEIVIVGKDERLVSLIRKLRRKNYDLILDLHSNIRSRLISVFTRGKVLRYHKDILSRYLLVYFKKVTSPLRASVVERYLATLSFLRLEKVAKKTKVYVTDQEKQEARNFLKKNKVKDTDVLIGLNPGARWKTKKWPSHHWLELIKLLRAQDYRIILFGDQNDRQDSELLGSIGEAPSIIVTTGQLDLRQIFALIEQCSVIVTGDSGPLHIAQALDIPVVVLLGPTVPEFGFILERENDVVLAQELACRPCSLHGTNTCVRGEPICMSGIKPEEVCAAVQKQILQRTK